MLLAEVRVHKHWSHQGQKCGFKKFHLSAHSTNTIHQHQVVLKGCFLGPHFDLVLIKMTLCHYGCNLSLLMAIF